MHNLLSEIEIQTILDHHDTIESILKEYKIYSTPVNTIEKVERLQKILGQYNFLNQIIIRCLLFRKTVSMSDIIHKVIDHCKPPIKVTPQRRNKLHEQLTILKNKTT